VFSTIELSLYSCLHDTRHGEIGVIVSGVSCEVKEPCGETRSNCPSLGHSFSVTWLSDLLKFGFEDIYRKCLFRILFIIYIHLNIILIYLFITD